MIYKFEKSKKKIYLLKLILTCGLFAVGLVLFSLILNNFVIDGPGFFAPFIFLAVFYVYIVIKSAKKYDTVSLEITEDSITISWKGRNVTVQLSEIQKISFSPTVFDNQQLFITYGKWKALTINSYFENFEEIKKLLENIKPIEKKSGIIRRIINILVILFIFLGFIAIIIPNNTLKYIFISAGLLASVFSIIRYSKSEIKKSNKITGIILYSFLTLLFIQSLIMTIVLK